MRASSSDRFAEVLEAHAGLMSRIASSYEADPSLCEDLLQEIALALWRALPNWRGEASLRTFVAKVAHNRGTSHVVAEVRRPRAGHAEAEPACTSAGPDRHTYLLQEGQRLQQAVRALPLGLRQAVTLALEGFSHAEIAAVLGIQANAVAVRLNRARTALKQSLGEAP